MAGPMDEYELQQELESMAQAATALDDEIGPEATDKAVARWQKLFGLSESDALDHIARHRNDLTRPTVSDEHWSTVQADREPLGYDREAYEYELGLDKKRSMLTYSDVVDESLYYLVELKDALPDVDAVCTAAGLSERPEIVEGTSSETWQFVELCCINAQARAALLKWAAERGHELTILVDPRSMRKGSR